MRIGSATWFLAAGLALGAWAGPVATTTTSSSSSSSPEEASAALDVLTSVGGHLSVDLTVAPWEQPGAVPPPAALYYAGQMAKAPPLLRAYPGDTIQVRVRSDLPSPVKKGRDEATGLALHGLRLEAAMPAAAGVVSRLAGPKLAIHTFTLSADHSPGLHWYRVGSDREEGPSFRGALQVLAKAAAAEQSIGSGGVRVLLLQYDPEEETYLVNGRPAHHASMMSVRAGEAQVLDVAHAGGAHLLEIEAVGEKGDRGGDCSLRLLALDGVPLPGGPRAVAYVGLATLQRARVLLTCQSAGAAVLVSRPSATRNGALSAGARWEQRLLAVTVTKGLSQLLPFNRRLPLHPLASSSPSSSGYPYQQGQKDEESSTRPWYLRELRDALAPPQVAACTLALACPPAAFCPARRHTCSIPEQEQRQLAANEPPAGSSLRELVVTLAQPGPPAAAVRLAPVRPFQILDFVPEEREEGNAYLQDWGQFGDWRDVLPPLAGTYRIRYTAADQSTQAPELQFDGFVVEEARGGHQRAMPAAAAVQPHEHQSHGGRSARPAQPGYEPAWALPIPGRTKGKLLGVESSGKGKGGQQEEAYLVVQATVAEERRNATWVEEALKDYLRPYLKSEEERASVTQLHVQELEEEEGAATAMKNDDHPPTVALAPDAITLMDKNANWQQQQHHHHHHQRGLAAISSNSKVKAIPYQMPRRLLPAGDRCSSDSDAALRWPVHFTLHLANASAVYPVINKLHALLVSPPPATVSTQSSSNSTNTPQAELEQEQRLPQLCAVNVTLLNSSFSAAADGRTTAAPATSAAAGGSKGPFAGAAKIPPNVVLMLAFAGGACLILLGFFAYRQLAYGDASSSSAAVAGGGRRTSRRASVQHFHDPTTIEQQITELDDSLSSTTLGVKSSALRHNSRSRNNSMTGLSAHAHVVFPSPRVPPHAPNHRLSGSISISGSGGISGSNSGADTSGSRPAATGGSGGGPAPVNSIAHYRSSSSLPTDLTAGDESHGRSSSLPHNGFGFFLPRRSSFNNISLSSSNKNNSGSNEGETK